MKRKIINSVLLITALALFSCDEPETTVTNIIHPDGSVTRRIEIHNKKHNFKPADVQVPFDSTWTIRDSLTIGTKKDTIWIKTAEKLLKNAEEINNSYSHDKGPNKNSERKVSFSKKFRWFNTIIVFSEKIDKSLLYGYPLTNFFSREEIDFYLLPESVSSEKLSGSDSTKYKSLKTSIDKKSEKYFWSCIVSEWIEEFSKLTESSAIKEISKETLKSRENEIVEIIEKKEITSDSVLISHFLGQANVKLYKKEVDTASAVLDRRVEKWTSFKEYAVKFKMPGKVISTNGFLKDGNELLWPVKPDFFLSQPYEMIAESKVTNIWAWIVTGIFVIFVFTGLMIKIFRKN